MKTKPARAKEFNSKVAAYSATATVALLAAPAVADAQGTIQNITSITGATSLSFPHNGGNVNQGFTAGPFHGVMNGSNLTLNHGQTYAGLARIFYGSGRLMASGGSIIKRFGLGDLLQGSTGAAILAIRSNIGSNFDGKFLPPDNGVGAVTGYVGFKRQLNAHTYYGWLRIQVQDDGNSLPDKISFLAKNGDPGIYGAYALANSGITAGEISSVPEPSIAALGGLSLLALGARGVREMRRRKNSVTSV